MIYSVLGLEAFSEPWEKNLGSEIFRRSKKAPEKIRMQAGLKKADRTFSGLAHVVK